MTSDSANRPLGPARRPGGRPPEAPAYRVLVHRKFLTKWEQVVTRVGLQQAQELWDHLAQHPARAPSTGRSCFLRGKAGKPQAPGWSRTIHYELSSMARVDYQYNDAYRTSPGGDPHPVVAILTVNCSSH